MRQSPSIVVLMLVFIGLQKPAHGDELPQDFAAAIVRSAPWTTSRITGSPDPPAPYRLVRVFPKVQLQNPVLLTGAPGGNRLFVAELRGKIYSFLPTPDAVAEPFFDARESNPRADNVYGMTFHPDFAQNRFCYICYTAGQNIDEGTRVSRFLVRNTDPPTVDPGSEQLVISWRSGGHNGGCLKFGPDGCLYISTGDAGPAFPPDPLLAGQDVSNLLSCVLRIDVDHGDERQPYAIPDDNPLVGVDGARSEIWAFGFRNPWRMSFDSVTGDLWVGDVGWELWEMVFRVERGANYGWSLVEGPQAVHRERPRGPAPISPPTAVHSHIEARSITGGFVYRGRRLPALVGRYIYGDYVTGKLWALPHDAQPGDPPVELADTPLQIICFGVDSDQELYVVGYDGTVHRLVDNTEAAANQAFPRRLSDTGLFAATADHAVAPGVVPYSINAEPWMDGATAQRFVALPGVTSLGVYDRSDEQQGFVKGQWQFPTDGVLMKTISIETTTGDPASQRRLETQILHFDVDTWRAYTYHWNDQQTDASLADDWARDVAVDVRDPSAPGGVRQQTWHFASRTECLLCHTTRGGTVYGFTPQQLDKSHSYDGVVANQLLALSQAGVFADPPSQPRDVTPNPYDSSEILDRRARAYMHVNCAHCHRRGGGGTAAMDVRFDLRLDQTDLLGQRPTQGAFGIHAAEVVAPGDPFRSVLLYRMAKLGRGRMPYIGSTVVDRAGLQLLHDWIAALPPSGPETNAGDVSDVRTAARRAAERALEQLANEHAGTESSDVAPQIAALLDTTSGALLALHAIDQGRLPSARADALVAAGARHDDVQIRDLFERFLPADQRTRRLGSEIDAAQLLALAGDAAAGRELFLRTSGAQCRNCHRVGEEGRALGPDLDGIGKKYSKAQLLESILEPSKKIDPQFVSYVVETADGRVHVGLLVGKTEQQLVLRNAEGREITIPAADVELLAPQRKSLMPDLQLQDMTAEQVADLLEFLAALGE